MKKIFAILGVVVFLIIVTIVIIVIVKSNEKEITPTLVINEKSGAPSRLYSNEEDVSIKKQKEIFDFIPKIYTEEIAPFSDEFVLNAVMDKIVSIDKTGDYNSKKVDDMVKKIFGKDVSINKNNVSTPSIEKSLYYYSKETDSYAIIPVGLEGIFKLQILKNVTETKDAYYVYAYALTGGYYYEDSALIDEFGNYDYDNSSVKVVIGNKDGKDLVHTFKNYSKIFDEDIWLSNYENDMPLYRYTLKKDGNAYYIIEVESINY